VEWDLAVLHYHWLWVSYIFLPDAYPSTKIFGSNLFQSQHKISDLCWIDLKIKAEFIELEFTSQRQNFLSAEVESKTPFLNNFC